VNYIVYAIKSERDGRIYVGMSSGIEKRLSEHNRGAVFSTRGFRPWKLIYIEDCGGDRLRAREKEKYFKSGCGKEFLKNIVIDPR